jgi:fumarate hydratase subunit alpha
MKNIKITTIKTAIAELIAQASFNLPEDIKDAISRFREKETKSSAVKILDLIIKNEQIAGKERLPLCQDCGNTYIDLEVGPDVFIEDSANLCRHIDRAVAEAYKKNYLRMSIVTDPLYERVNTRDNTPALVTIRYGSRPGLGISVTLKGGGSENCSYLSMENPSAGPERIIEMVLEIVRKNVTKCCPPVIAGIGIGSTATEVVRLAKAAAFRRLDIRNDDKKYRMLEGRILEEINGTGIGPQGLGGYTTAIGCNIEYAPCHMATLPVSVFLQCHSLRRAGSRILQ